MAVMCIQTTHFNTFFKWYIQNKPHYSGNKFNVNKMGGLLLVEACFYQASFPQLRTNLTRRGFDIPAD